MRVFLLWAFTFLPLFSKVHLSEEQIKNLETVREIALKYKDNKGESYPNTIAAICMTESSCGINMVGDLEVKKGKFYASLGALQIRVPTARYLSSIFPKKLKELHSMTDVTLRKKLLTDIKLSAKIASLYIVHLSNKRKSYFKAVSGYNGGVYNYKYFNKVMKWNKELKKLKINF